MLANPVQPVLMHRFMTDRMNDINEDDEDNDDDEDDDDDDDDDDDSLWQGSVAIRHESRQLPH